MTAITAARTAAVVALVLAAACGGASTTPSVVPGSVTIATGPHVLRLTYSGFTCSINGVSPVPLVYTRVTVSQAGNEWTATPASAASGDVELRFHQTSSSLVAGSMPVEGTIRGQAIHLPDLAAGQAPWTSSMNFGSDGRTAVTGLAFGPASQPPASGLAGSATGTVSVSDGAGTTCGGGNVSWTLSAGG